MIEPLTKRHADTNNTQDAGTCDIGVSPDIVTVKSIILQKDYTSGYQNANSYVVQTSHTFEDVVVIDSRKGMPYSGAHETLACRDKKDSEDDSIEIRHRGK